jgi:hypothetical protein
MIWSSCFFKAKAWSKDIVIIMFKLCNSCYSYVLDIKGSDVMAYTNVCMNSFYNMCLNQLQN